MKQESNNIFIKEKLPIIIKNSKYNVPYSDDTNFPIFNVGSNVEICIVAEGLGIHRIMNEITECRKGDIYIIHSGVSHSFFANSNGDFPDVVTISFDPKSVLETKWQDSSNRNFCYGVFRDYVPVSYALLNSHSLFEVLNICTKLENELNEKLFECNEASRAYLVLLLITLARYINLADTAQIGHSKDWVLVTAAMSEIYNRCSDTDMTLESIAASLYISKSHLSRIFQKVVGQSFLDYVRNVRINKACNLLKNSDLTNEEIVGRCGLKDIPSFYKLFKTTTGMTPHQYRTSEFNIIPSKPVSYENILKEISESIQTGRVNRTCELVLKALDDGIPAFEILNDGLLDGMNTVADKFKSNEVFVPTVLTASRAMNQGLELLKTKFNLDDIQNVGRVCIGTVRGDLHDIGKNLVKTLMENKGLQVFDLGTDVSPDEFIKTAIEKDCKIICCSALLTTTMSVMEEIVMAAKNAGIRESVKIIIGGAPVTENFCKQIGADYYAPDAASAADFALNNFR